MAYVFVPGTKLVKVAIEGLWYSQKTASTFWVEGDIEPIAATMEALADHFRDVLYESFRSSLSSNFALTRITATRQNNANDIQIARTPVTPIQGTGGAASVPLNCSWCFTHRTALRGRSYRGRTYWPGFYATLDLGGGVGNITTLSSLASNMVNSLITLMLEGWTWVVASHFTGGHDGIPSQPRPLALQTPITGVTIDTLMDSQRRRLVGRGS